jgi:3-hexulose-6-phosphate synthase
MDLQVALDRIPLDDALAVVESTADLVDWIEFGTSMIKQFGVAGLQTVVAAAGPTPVLADTKTVDDVRFELGLVYDAGARSATVLGLAPEVTREAATTIAAEHGCELVMDLMGLSTSQITAMADALPRTVVLAPHVSKDHQGGTARPADLLGAWARGRSIALAGGLTAHDLPALADWPDLRVIVGSAVTRAANPRDAVLELRRASGKDNA